MPLPDGQVHYDTHAFPMGNYVIAVGNYVIVTCLPVGNYVTADTCVVLRYYPVLTVADIATALGIQEGTVKRYLSESKTSMGELLSQVEQG